MSASQNIHIENEIKHLQKRLNILRKLNELAKIQELKKQLGSANSFKIVPYRVDMFGSIPSKTVVEVYLIAKKKRDSKDVYLLYAPKSNFFVRNTGEASIDNGCGCFMICWKKNKIFENVNGYEWANVDDKKYLGFVQSFSKTTSKWSDEYINLVCKKLDLEGKQRAKQQLADFKKSKK